MTHLQSQGNVAHLSIPSPFAWCVNGSLPRSVVEAENETSSRIDLSVFFMSFSFRLVLDLLVFNVYILICFFIRLVLGEKS